MFRPTKKVTQSDVWQDPPPLYRAERSEPPRIHPLTERFFNSVFALAFQALFFLSLALAAGGWAFGVEWERIGQILLGLVFFVMGLLGLSFLLSALTLNVKQLFAIRVALQELSQGRDINGDGAIGVVNSQAVPAEPQTVERIELIPTNRAPKQILEVGDVTIDRRDFIAFLHRSWETNGEEEKGISRVWWCGGATKSGNRLPKYIFTRADGTRVECTRPLYDAIINKLESLGEVGGRGNGWSGKLLRDPKIWLAEMKWI